MLCPDCDVPMNRHAEKPLMEEGVLAAIHCCPGCGRIEAEPLL